MPKKVFPKDTQESAWLFDLARKRHPSVPLTETQAIMEALPHEEPLRAYQRASKYEDPIKEALITLTDSELEIVMLLAFEQLSLRVAGRILGIPKTTLARRRDKIYARLKEQLEENSIIWERIHGETSEH